MQELSVRNRTVVRKIKVTQTQIHMTILKIVITSVMCFILRTKLYVLKYNGIPSSILLDFYFTFTFFLLILYSLFSTLLLTFNRTITQSVRFTEFIYDFFVVT